MLLRISIRNDRILPSRDLSRNLHHFSDLPVALLQRTGKIDGLDRVTEIKFFPENGHIS